MKDSGSLSLASQLYEVAIRKKADNKNALISKTLVDAQLGKIDTEDASARAADVVLDGASTPFQLREALNVLTSLNSYSAMLDVTTAALASDEIQQAVRPSLHRNRAVALTELNQPREEVIGAYNAALESSVTDIDYSNTARPYGGYLRRVGEWELARSVVETALERDPTEAQLMIQLADLVRRDGDYARASQLLALARENGDDPTEAFEAESRRLKLLQEIASREKMEEIMSGTKQPSVDLNTANPQQLEGADPG